MAEEVDVAKTDAILAEAQVKHEVSFYIIKVSFFVSIQWTSSFEQHESLNKWIVIKCIVDYIAMF